MRVWPCDACLLWAEQKEPGPQAGPSCCPPYIPSGLCGIGSHLPSPSSQAFIPHWRIQQASEWLSVSRLQTRRQQTTASDQIQPWDYVYGPQVKNIFRFLKGCKNQPNKQIIKIKKNAQQRPQSPSCSQLALPRAQLRTFSLCVTTVFLPGSKGPPQPTSP